MKRASPTAQQTPNTPEPPKLTRQQRRWRARKLAKRVEQQKREDARKQARQRLVKSRLDEARRALHVPGNHEEDQK